MIKTSRQVKDLTRNKANGDSFKAQLLIRNFMMERLLERISLSKYKENFVLKGGMLISSLVGIDNRKTKDIDTTIRDLELSCENIQTVFDDITNMDIGDNVKFNIRDLHTIMEDAEYSGIRVSLEASLDTMRVPLQIDVSTGDAITPSAIDYEYKLMYEDRKISICAYNLETILAEKIETVVVRGIYNTRLRDFYDIHILFTLFEDKVNFEDLKHALQATSTIRKTIEIVYNADKYLQKVKTSEKMKVQWTNFQKQFDYARECSWDKVMDSVIKIYEKIDR